jgi:hypothetical protein
LLFDLIGLRTEGIYRKSGQKSKVAALLNYMVEGKFASRKYG